MIINKSRYLFISCCVLLSSCAKKNISKESNNVMVSYNLALLELEKYGYTETAYKKALFILEKNNCLQQQSPLVLGLQATLLFRIGNLYQAKKYFEQARMLSDDKWFVAELNNNYACVLAALGHCEDALEIWHNLSTSKEYLTPEVALVNSGRVYLQQQLYRHAHNNFSKALYCSPGFLDAYFYRAVASYCLKDTIAMERDIAYVISIEPLHKGVEELRKMVAAEKLND